VHGVRGWGIQTKGSSLDRGLAREDVCRKMEISLAVGAEITCKTTEQQQ